MLTFSISSAFFNCFNLTSFSLIFSINCLRSARSSLFLDVGVFIIGVLPGCLFTTWSLSRRAFFTEDITGDTKGRLTPLRASPLSRCKMCNTKKLMAKFSSQSYELYNHATDNAKFCQVKVLHHTVHIRVMPHLNSGYRLRCRCMGCFTLTFCSRGCKF